jgi:hypothetical protein
MDRFYHVGSMSTAVLVALNERAWSEDSDHSTITAAQVRVEEAYETDE